MDYAPCLDPLHPEELLTLHLHQRRILMKSRASVSSGNYLELEGINLPLSFQSHTSSRFIVVSISALSMMIHQLFQMPMLSRQSQ